jgi:hypothetical protein
MKPPASLAATEDPRTEGYVPTQCRQTRHELIAVYVYTAELVIK